MRHHLTPQRLVGLIDELLHNIIGKGVHHHKNKVRQKGLALDLLCRLLGGANVGVAVAQYIEELLSL